jgi:SMI1-KNR4 cell-wall
MDYFTFISEKLKPFREYGELDVDINCTLICHNIYTDRASWCHWLYKPMDENEINKLEIEIKKNIHESYKLFLLQMNGIGIFHSSINLFGNDIDYNTGKRISSSPFGLLDANEYRFNFGERPIQLSDDVLVIGGYGNDGSGIGILESSGKVIRYDKYSLEVYNEWSSFEGFFVSEFERLSKMFNTDGTKKDLEFSTIPPQSTYPENSTINLVRTDDYTFYKKPVKAKSKRDEW